MATDTYVEEVISHREEKDSFFDSHQQSPIPPEKRDSFDGLNYYDPVPEHRVEATVTTHDEPEPVVMETTGGSEVRYLREVTFSFELDGTERTLGGYRQEADEKTTLFVPFRDKTTGQETYYQGRYMEFESEQPLSDGDTATLDFNLAYNPFCAFTDTFSCPLPPEENWLETTVPAGEKIPEL